MRSVEALEHIPDDDVLDGGDQPPLAYQENTYRLRVVGNFAFDAPSVFRAARGPCVWWWSFTFPAAVVGAVKIHL
jgi:hypothetical protein